MMEKETQCTGDNESMNQDHRERRVTKNNRYH